jgi:outer membrane protein TolC
MQTFFLKKHSNHKYSWDTYKALKIKNYLLFIGLLILTLFSASSHSSELSVIIDTALKNNYQIRNSEFEVISSEYDYRKGMSDFFPKIDFKANTTWNEADTTAHTPNAPTNQNSYNSNGYSVSLSQKLIDFTTFHNYEISSLELEINQVKHNKIINDVIVKVVEEYFSYLKYHAQYIATVAELKSATHRFNSVKRNNELGNIAKTDVYEAYASKQSTFSKLSDMQKNKRIALLKLQSSTQIKVKPSVDLPIGANFKGIEAQQKPKLKKEMFNRNYDIVIARYDDNKSHKSLRKSRSNFYPKLSTNVKYDFSDSNNGEGTDTDSMSYSLNLDIPITNGGSDYYTYQKNKNSVEQAQVKYEQTLNDSQLDFEELFYKINHNVLSLSTLRSMIISNYFVYKGNLRAYKIGSKQLTDLLSSESNLYDSIRDYQMNQYDYIINMAKFKALLGPINLNEIDELSQNMLPLKEKFDIKILDNLKQEF